MPQADREAAPLSCSDRLRLQRRLLDWFRRNARDLPWRHTRDPYAIWVSEIMLQQTQVATVVEYYLRFLRAFPSVEALAAAAETEVLRAWEGLGYYRRARNLHRAARMVVTEHGGRLPRDPDALRRLPGIGRYTAGAILSMAFDVREPILEANSRRLLIRLFAVEGDPGSPAIEKRLWALAALLLPKRNAGQFNQALMELGSLVCAPAAPNCVLCPVNGLCQSRLRGLERSLPIAAKKPATTAVREAAVIVRRRGRVLVLQRPDRGRWSAMFDFPRFAIECDEAALQDTLRKRVSVATGITIGRATHVGTIAHTVTRFRIALDCYLAAAVESRNGATPDAVAKPTCWLRVHELEQVPMSVSARRICRWLRGGPLK